MKVALIKIGENAQVTIQTSISLRRISNCIEKGTNNFKFCLIKESENCWAMTNAGYTSELPSANPRILIRFAHEYTIPKRL